MGDQCVKRSDEGRNFVLLWFPLLARTFGVLATMVTEIKSNCG